jgi:hypothetical protein
MAASNIHMALSVISWDTATDYKGNIIMLEQTRHDCFTPLQANVFKHLATFIRKGSYLAFIDEDGDVFRWWFTGRYMRYQRGKLTWK